jgi:hypothetical protein
LLAGRNVGARRGACVGLCTSWENELVGGDPNPRRWSIVVILVNDSNTYIVQFPLSITRITTLPYELTKHFNQFQYFRSKDFPVPSNVLRNKVVVFISPHSLSRYTAYVHGHVSKRTSPTIRRRSPSRPRRSSPSLPNNTPLQMAYLPPPVFLLRTFYWFSTARHPIRLVLPPLRIFRHQLERTIPQ